MRNPKRIDIVIEELRNLWKTIPDFRFAQLFMNLVETPDPFYMEDEFLLKRIREYKEHIERIKLEEIKKHG
jgi:hypothetical protein